MNIYGACPYMPVNFLNDVAILKIMNFNPLAYFFKNFASSVSIVGTRYEMCLVKLPRIITERFA